MTRHFVRCFVNNITYLVDYLYVCSLSIYLILSDMQMRQPVTSDCIMSVHEIAYFVAKNNMANNRNCSVSKL